MIIGIDPGVTGAVGVLYLGGQATGVSAHDLPMVTTPNKRGTERVLDIQAFSELITDLADDYNAVVWLEKTQPMKDSAMTAFSMGQMRGMLLATLRMLKIPVHEVTPQAWKKEFGLTKCDKDASRNAAGTMLPKCGPYITRKLDHNRAESILIALYGKRQMRKYG
jgi:Holliday junction resolvasome, endonuclease subunit